MRDFAEGFALAIVLALATVALAQFTVTDTPRYRRGVAAGSQPAASSQVQVTMTGGTATDPDDYDASSFPLTVTFPASSTSEAVPISIIDDGDPEDFEMISFSLTAVDNASLGTSNTSTLEVLDNDSTALPHDIRGSPTNYLTNGNLRRTSGWALEGGAVYDATVTATADGSGSVKIMSASTAEKAWSPFIDVSAAGDGFFMYTFKARSDVVPNRFGAQLPHFNSRFSFQFNDAGIPHGDVGIANTWQEVTQIRWVDVSATPKLRIQVFGREKPLGTGTLWFDDFALIKLSEPPMSTWIAPPPTKAAFSGGRFRVDELGNWQRLNGSTWENFFLWAMHTDKSRPNYDAFSADGWNVSVWESVNAGVQKAEDAGMFAMLQMSHYIQRDIFPATYNNITLLNSRLDEIINAGNLPVMAGYWWDHEDDWEEWQVPIDVMAAVRAKDPNAPIVVLNGNPMAAAAIAQAGIVDTDGTYSKNNVDHVANRSTNMALTATNQGLRHLPNNTAPTSFALISSTTEHVGAFRLAVYNNVLRGARGIVYFGDNVSGEPVYDTAIFQPDVANVTSEVATLLTLIREPHWTTTWGATSSTINVRVGTRNMGSRRFVWLVNQTTSNQSVTVILTGSHGYVNGDDVLDYLNEATHVTDIRSGSFTVNLGALGLANGTEVYELVNAP